MRFISLSIASATLTLLAAASTFADSPGKHPAYLHALADLRDARAHLEHLSSDSVDHQDEHAIAEIDKAIMEIKHASIDDGKNVSDHMPVGAHLVPRDRYRKAIELLNKAKRDASGEEDQVDTQGLQMRVIHHIDDAKHEVHRVIDTVLNQG